MNERLYKYKFRVGRKLRRTIYVQLGSEPGDDDMFVGIADTSDLAQHIIDSHNERRTAQVESLLEDLERYKEQVEELKEENNQLSARVAYAAAIITGDATDMLVTSLRGEKAKLKAEVFDLDVKLQNAQDKLRELGYGENDG